MTYLLPPVVQATQAAVAPILHLRTLNPYLHSALSGDSLLTQVARQSLPWPASTRAHSLGSSSIPEGRLLGGVSSFAFMGTNGHALVAGPPTSAGVDAAVLAGAVWPSAHSFT